jgi:4-carboxymuconolactone decarboxylase
MSIRLSILVVALFRAVSVAGQSQLPPDINSVTLSRLPPVARDDLDADSQRLLDARQNVTPGPGPGHILSYSPRLAEGLGPLGRYLGVPRGETFPLGARYFQLVVLITAREIDQQYEWSAHEPMGRQAGLDQSVIDVIKYDRDVTGLAEKDATVIRFFRALLRDHKASSELWRRMVEGFGRQRTIEMMALMGDYFMVGMMMNAVDQHLPPERQPLLTPATKR